ncbi:MAG: hypothetical protein Q8R39_02550 [bacterium]|nr:hypothetical protein [bacterium]MDZ4284509.1 hypothetical protein [Patescibacteria group bacterium]
MEQTPTVGNEASNENAVQSEEHTREEAVAIAEKMFADLYREDPEVAEEAWERAKRNRDMQ